jgi:ABC-type microcin C transport system permease subunit YejB
MRARRADWFSTRFTFRFLGVELPKSSRLVPRPFTNPADALDEARQPDRIATFIADNPDLETPFVVVDLQIVADRYHQLASALPMADIFYAIKANPAPEILRLLVSLGSRFDVASSIVVVIGNAIPAFLFAVLLLVLFAGGSYVQWFPLRGLTSDNWEMLSWPARIGDYFWHLVLPITAMVIGGFATLTMLTKNSFLDQINQQYVLTARAKGLSERRVLWGHVFRNAMLIVIAGFPAAFVGILFTGTVFIEIIFSLDGLGLLGFEAAFQRDYPLMFGTLWFFSLVGLVLNLVGDLMYTIVDPRIDFESRRA